MYVLRSCLLLCCVGSGPCDELFTRTEESYWVCVWLYVIQKPQQWGNLSQCGLLCHRKKLSLLVSLDLPNSIFPSDFETIVMSPYVISPIIVASFSRPIWFDRPITICWSTSPGDSMFREVYCFYSSTLGLCAGIMYVCMRTKIWGDCLGLRKRKQGERGEHCVLRRVHGTSSLPHIDNL